MSYKVTAPLVVIANADPEKGGDWYGYDGATVPEGHNDERCKQLVKEGFLEVVDASADSGKPSTVDEILDAVGDDPAKAAAALEEENAAKKPRKSLVEKLQAVVDAGKE